MRLRDCAMFLLVNFIVLEAASAYKGTHIAKLTPKAYVTPGSVLIWIPGMLLMAIKWLMYMLTLCLVFAAVCLVGKVPFVAFTDDEWVLFERPSEQVAQLVSFDDVETVVNLIPMPQGLVGNLAEEELGAVPMISEVFVNCWETIQELLRHRIGRACIKIKRRTRLHEVVEDRFVHTHLSGGEIGPNPIRLGSTDIGQRFADVHRFNMYRDLLASDRHDLEFSIQRQSGSRRFFKQAVSFVSGADSRACAEPLKSCDSRVENYRNKGEPTHTPHFLVMGSILFLVGLMLSYQVWFKFDLYFPRNSSDAIPVALIVLSAVLMWSGGMFLLAGFGMWP